MDHFQFSLFVLFVVIIAGYFTPNKTLLYVWMFCTFMDCLLLVIFIQIKSVSISDLNLGNFNSIFLDLTGVQCQHYFLTLKNSQSKKEN